MKTSYKIIILLFLSFQSCSVYKSPSSSVGSFLSVTPTKDNEETASIALNHFTKLLGYSNLSEIPTSQLEVAKGSFIQSGYTTTASKIENEINSRTNNQTTSKASNEEYKFDNNITPQNNLAKQEENVTETTNVSSNLNNAREIALKEIENNAKPIFRTKNTNNNASSNSQNNISSNKISKSEINKTSTKENYRRSSLYTLMLSNDAREHASVIRNAFGNAPLPEKFNDHNIGPYLININEQAKDQTVLITNYLNENDIAKKIVSKWFNRDNNGLFNMDLVAERGNYDANALDISIAKNSERGFALVADAGEELIKNTFVIVNDYKYTNKEEVAKKAGGFLKIVSSVASYIPGGSTISTASNYTRLGVGIVGKGYVIKTTSYLYKLVWDEQTAATFYNNHWVDKNNIDENKIKAFEKSNDYRLELVGSENAWADIQSTVFTSKSDEEIIRIATVKATDKAISKLQRKFEAFRTKSPLLSGDPISAKIGLKEGLEKEGNKYEVLEQVVNSNGTTEYKRVGIIKVDKNHIWDNRFMANEETSSSFEYTTFSGAKNKFFAGMLIRQID